MRSNKTLATAHAGCMNTAMDSLEAVQVALEFNADIIEVDVRFSNELVPVLSHDKVKNEKINEYVTLEEVFQLVYPFEKVSLNLDMKEYHSFHSIKALVEKYNMSNRVFFTGIEFENVEAVKSLDLGIPYFINHELETTKLSNKEYLEELCNMVDKVNGIGLNLDYKFVSSELVEFFHQNHKYISAWTVNDEEVMTHLISIDVDSITSRRIDLLIKSINKH